MPTIVPIVEGDGEVEAVPVLLRRLLEALNRWDLLIGRPKNANGHSNLIKPGGIEKFLQYAAGERDCAAILVLIDANTYCAKELAHALAERTRALNLLQSVVIVCAKCEYEAWFLASLETIAGQNLGGRTGLPAGLRYDGNVEGRRNVKGWLTGQMPAGRAYKETSDQAPMTARIDIGLAQSHSRSFRRLCHALNQVLEAIDQHQSIVTP